MLREVGASGQISLGKKFAGQLFDMVVCADGRIELVPMKVVPAVENRITPTDAGTNWQVSEDVAQYRIGDGWLTPERLARRRAAAARSPQENERLAHEWQQQNKDAIDAMNERCASFGSMGWRIHEWRNANSERDRRESDAN